MLRNYEDSFKIAARVALNSMDIPDDLTMPERLVICEIFRFVFMGMRDGHIFDEIRKFLVKIRSEEEGLFILFDAYFKFMTKYCSPLTMVYDEGQKVLLVIDQWREIWDNKAE
jgi:hypothetical protein